MLGSVDSSRSSTTVSYAALTGAIQLLVRRQKKTASSTSTTKVARSTESIGNSSADVIPMQIASMNRGEVRATTALGDTLLTNGMARPLKSFAARSFANSIWSGWRKHDERG